MLREGLTITFEYREKCHEPYFCRTEVPIHKIDMADKNFEHMIGLMARDMWRKMEKELFDRA